MLLFLIACTSEPAPSPPPAEASPHQALAELDNRAPVPLQPRMAWHQKQNMMDHLVAIQGITEALARRDWPAVSQAAAKIQSSPQMQMQCEHMGSGAPGFTELALDFHRRADAIGEAASREDVDGVLSATASTLAACTGCHAKYRQDVVDAATWTSRTGTEHVPAH